jgi:hypothetical protein
MLGKIVVYRNKPALVVATFASGALLVEVEGRPVLIP